jgi:hypothetical protein
MNLFGGGGGPKVKPQYTGLATQTSSSALAVAIGMGTNRAAPNIIYQDDFKAHKVKQKTGKGGGKKTVGYTYSGTYILSLGWGEAAGILRTWKDQSKETDYAELGFTFIPGTIPQAPWGYLTTNHPDKALGYPGLVLMAVPNYDLGQTNTLGQHSFEVQWPLAGTAPGSAGDADCGLCVDLFLNSPIYGALPDGSIDADSLLSTGAAPTTGDAAYQTYCTAMGFGMSPLLDSQEPAIDILKRWTKIFNSALIWTGYSIFFMPYGPDEITANGVTYLPDFTSQFALGDADFLREDGEDPIKCRRKSPADCMNFVPLEIRNRANEYNLLPVGLPDQGLVDQFGQKSESTVKAHEICEASIGEVCAALVQARAGYVRNEFEFTLGPNWMLLLPGAVGTVTDPRFGTINVMLIEIEETDEGRFHCIAEEWNASISTPGPAAPGEIDNNPINTNVPAGPVNPPILFEPPSTLGGSSPQVWMAVSGGDGTDADPNWGGCLVHLSTDNISYQPVGEITTAARMGILGTGGLASYGGANPDTIHTCPVDLSMSEGELDGVTSADAAAALTISIIKDAGGAIEYFSYMDATLTGDFEYDLEGELYRGLHGTAKAAHAAGSHFARLDENIFHFALPEEWIGQTLYAKFQSYNIFGGGLEDLASCTAYSYTPSGAGYGGGTGGVPSTPAAPTVSGPAGFNLVTWTAAPASDNVIRYEIWRATGASQPFGSASLIGTSTGTSFTDTTAASGQAYTYFIVAVNAVGSSANSPGSNVTSGASGQPFGFSFVKGPVADKILAPFDSPIAWTIPAGLTDAQGTIIDSDTGTATAPSAQTDFDIQSPPGSSIGTMRFAASSLTATFIKASSSSIPLGQIVQIVAPSNLNGIAGNITGSIKGSR